MSKKPATIQGEKRTKMALTVAFTVIAIVYLLPVEDSVVHYYPQRDALHHYLHIPDSDEFL